MALEHETKFIVPYPRVAPVLAVLRALLEPDPLHPVNVVVSIYFDTLALDGLADKLASQHHKRKLRLRWYEDAGSGRPLPGAFLELKHRLGSCRWKERIPAPHPSSRLAALKLDDPLLAALPAASRVAGLASPPGLVPVLALHYRRHRFRDRFSSARVSLDTGIAVRGVSRRVLPRGGAFRPLPHAVLEAKSATGSLPRCLEPLLALGPRLDCFSKYAACLAAEAA